MLNRFAQHAIACVLCELLCLELFNVFFQHENRFRYKFFDIVQFSRSRAPQPTGWRLDYFITEVIFCQALFSKRFEHFELGLLQTSQNWLESFSVYWFFSFASQLGLQKSFFCLSAWRSSIIPYTRPFGNPFFQLFCPFFSVRPFYQFFAWNSHLLWRDGYNSLFFCFLSLYNVII